jgi:hypothetical protein
MSEDQIKTTFADVAGVTSKGRGQGAGRLSA